MGLANPIFLYAFGGLLIPIAIHLWSRNTRKTVAFGSLRFISETDTKTVRNFLPSELLLLILRILVLTCLIMMLCAPFTFQKPTKETAYLIDERLSQLKEQIEKALSEEAYTQSFDLSANSEGYASLDFWTQLKGYSQFDSLVIFSPGYLTDFKDDRPESIPNIYWINMTPESPKGLKTSVVAQSDEENLKISQSQSSTHINYQRTTTEAAGTPLEIKIYFNTDPTYKEHERLLRAVLSAIGQTSPVTFQVTTFDQDELAEKDWLIWLSPSAPSAFRRNLIYLKDQEALIQERSVDIFTLKQDATVADFISQSFPLKLESILTQGLPQSLGFVDTRQISESQLFGNTTQTIATKELNKKSITHFFLIGFLLLLLAERTLSALQYRR